MREMIDMSNRLLYVFVKNNDLNKIAYLPNVNATGGIIYASITDKSPVILEIIFQRRHTKHEHYGYYGNFLAKGIYGWHPIK